MVDLRRKFTLDWLGDGGGSSGGSGAGGSGTVGAVGSSVAAEKPAPPDEATLYFYSQPLVERLRQAPGQQMHVYELAKESVENIRDFKFDNCLSVIHRLDDLGVLRIVEHDPSGNHLVRLLEK